MMPKEESLMTIGEFGILESSTTFFVCFSVGFTSVASEGLCKKKIHVNKLKLKGISKVSYTFNLTLSPLL